MDKPVTIIGTGFRNGATLSLVQNSTTIPGIITNRTTTKILATFPLSGASVGSYNLTIQNIDGTEVTKNYAFTVHHADLNPVITDYSPKSGVNSAALPITITGREFRKGVTVTITNRSTSKTVAGVLTGSTTIKAPLPPEGSALRPLQPHGDKHRWFI